MNIWQKLAVEKSNDTIQEFVKELQDEVKVLRAENVNLKCDIERLETKENPLKK